MKYVICLMILALIACKDGERGEIGAQGIPGQNAPLCTVSGIAGGALVQCPDGSSQFISDGTNGQNGQDGNTGEQGSKGDKGDQGDPGQDISPISWVQFCSGVTNYPVRFVEGGFCIGNKIYAVYSINNGFLTYIPPGAYSSNAMNSSCNFVVHENCEVTH